MSSQLAALTEDTAPALDDWLYKVPNAGTSGGDRKVKVSTVAGVRLISSSTLGAAAASVTFSSIPQTYSHLRVHMLVRGDRSGSNEDNVLVRFNGDTAANYDRQYTYFTTSASATATVGQTSILLGNMPASVSTADTSGVHDFLVAGYTVALHKTLISNGLDSFDNTNAASQLRWASGGKWRSTAAITSITVLAAVGNFVAGSKFSLYGSV